LNLCMKITDIYKRCNFSTETHFSLLRYTISSEISYFKGK
jgi:AraC-like DNA-binding protein